MKTFRLLILALFFFAGSQIAHAQTAYTKGDKIASLGVSFGNYGYGFAGSRSGGFIPITASLEFGVHESISVGPYVGYASWNYDYSFGSNYSSNFLSVGAKGSWHYVPFINRELNTSLDEQKLDFYVSLFLGLENRSFGYDDNSFAGQRSNVTRLVFAPVLGFKYMFNPRFGAFVELGRGTFGYSSLGVSAHF